MDALLEQNDLFRLILTFCTCRNLLPLTGVSKQWDQIIHRSITKLYFQTHLRTNIEAHLQGYSVFRSPKPEDFPRFLARFPNLQTLSFEEAGSVPLAEVFPKCPALLSLTLLGLGPETEVLNTLCLLPNPLTKLSLSWGVALLNNRSITTEHLVPLWNFLKKHGPGLVEIDFLGFAGVAQLMTDDELQHIGSWCPKLEFFDMRCSKQTQIPGNTAFVFDDPSKPLKFNLQMKHCVMQNAESDAWLQLSDPAITGIVHLSIFGGSLKDNSDWDDDFVDPPEGLQTNIAEIFKNNKIQDWDLDHFYNFQLQEAFPYCKYITMMHWFGLVPNEETWKVLGRELTSLRIIRTLDAHGVNDTHMKAWVSEMPPGSQVVSVEHRFSKVTPYCVAVDIVPRCPLLCHTNVGGIWNDETIEAWTKCPAKLCELELNEWDSFSSATLQAFIESGNASELVRLILRKTMNISDDFILSLVTHCRHLAHLEILIATGVSQEGWEALRQLPPFRELRIGSDTCSRDFITSLCSIPPNYFNPSPAAIQAKLDKKEAAKKAKADEKERQVKLAQAWADEFFQQNKETLLKLCGTKISEIPNEAVKMLKATGCPKEFSQNGRDIENHLKTLGNKLKGELMKIANEEKKRLAEERKKQEGPK